MKKNKAPPRSGSPPANINKPQDLFHNSERNQRKNKIINTAKSNSFEAAAAVCGTSSIDIIDICWLFGPTSRLRTLLHCCLPSFLLSSTAVSLRLTVPPTSPFPWTPSIIADTWRLLLNVASLQCHLTMKRSATSRTPPVPLCPPSFLPLATARSSFQTSTTTTLEECSVDPSVPRNTLEVVN